MRRASDISQATCGRFRRASRGVACSAAVAGLFVQAACSMLLDSSGEQCVSDADCDARGGALVGARCVDRSCRSVRAETPRPSASSVAPTGEQAELQRPADRFACAPVQRPSVDPLTKVTIRQQFITLVTGEPLRNVTLRVCPKADPSCRAPRGTVTSDAQGFVKVEMQRGFDAYLELASSPMQPSLFLVDPPVADRVLDQALVLSRSQLTSLAAYALGVDAGSAVKTDMGHVLARVADCRGIHVAEAILASSTTHDATTRPFYVLDGVPSPTAPWTDAAGAGGFINLPQGFTTITATLSDGRKIGQANVLVRAGYLTYVTLSPVSSAGS